MTEWRPVVGHEDGYEISNSGCLRFVKATQKHAAGSIHPGHYINASGYPMYNLAIKDTGKGRQRAMLLHRMVAQAFIPNPDGHPIVRHLDSNVLNFSIENLAWGTQKENVHDAIALGRWHGSRNKTHCINGHEYTPDNRRAHGTSIVCMVCARLGGLKNRAKDPEATRLKRRGEYQRRKARKLLG